MADKSLITRRALMVAAPAAALAGPVAAEAETPVAVLFREWQRLDAIREAHFLDKEDDEFERADDARWAHEQILIHTPSRCERDLLLKIVAWTAYGEIELDAERDNSHLSTLWAEARALVAA